MTDRELEPIENVDETPNAKQMRETIERQSAELSDLRGFKRDALMDGAGFDPLTGVGKAIAKDIERGEYEGDLTAAGLQDYAKDEYSWEPGEASPDTDDAEAEAEAARSLVSKGAEELDEVRNAGSPPDTEDAADRANAAGAEENWSKQILEGTSVTFEAIEGT